MYVPRYYCTFAFAILPSNGTLNRFALIGSSFVGKDVGEDVGEDVGSDVGDKVGMALKVSKLELNGCY